VFLPRTLQDRVAHLLDRERLRRRKVLQSTSKAPEPVVGLRPDDQAALIVKEELGAVAFGEAKTIPHVLGDRDLPF